LVFRAYTAGNQFSPPSPSPVHSPSTVIAMQNGALVAELFWSIKFNATPYLAFASPFWSAFPSKLSRARSRRAPQQSLCAQILIHVRPMDSVAAASDAPVFSLGSRGVQ
jgi:hypothetical protein